MPQVIAIISERLLSSPGLAGRVRRVMGSGYAAGRLSRRHAGFTWASRYAHGMHASALCCGCDCHAKQLQGRLTVPPGRGPTSRAERRLLFIAAARDLEVIRLRLCTDERRLLRSYKRGVLTLGYLGSMVNATSPHRCTPWPDCTTWRSGSTCRMSRWRLGVGGEPAKACVAAGTFMPRLVLDPCIWACSVAASFDLDGFLMWLGYPPPRDIPI